MTTKTRRLSANSVSASQTMSNGLLDGSLMETKDFIPTGSRHRYWSTRETPMGGFSGRGSHSSATTDGRIKASNEFEKHDGTRLTFLRCCWGWGYSNKPRECERRSLQRVLGKLSLTRRCYQHVGKLWGV